MPSSAIISVEELHATVMNGTPPTLLDLRWTLADGPVRAEYERGHIPQAVFVDLDRELAGPPGPGGRHPLPDLGVFEAAMRVHGVWGRRPVVVYDDGPALVAARAWWMLRYFGHAGVRVLDGGYRAWREAGLPEEVGAGAAPRPGDFTAQAGGMPLLGADDAMALARHGLLIDVRASERYRGEVESVDPVAGHIPGAHNLPTAGNCDASGRFLDRSALQTRWAAVGVRPGEDVATYCGSGVSAAHAVLALELTGVPAGLFLGSWSEYITNPQRPVATGPEPG